MECWGPKWEILLISTGESKIWDAGKGFRMISASPCGAAYGFNETFGNAFFSRCKCE